MGAVRIYKEPNPDSPYFPWQSRIVGCATHSWEECESVVEHEGVCAAYPSYRSVLMYLNDSHSIISRYISK